MRNILLGFIILHGISGTEIGLNTARIKTFYSYQHCAVLFKCTRVEVDDGYFEIKETVNEILKALK